MFNTQTSGDEVLSLYSYSLPVGQSVGHVVLHSGHTGQVISEFNVVVAISVGMVLLGFSVEGHTGQSVGEGVVDVKSGHVGQSVVVVGELSGVVLTVTLLPVVEQSVGIVGQS